MQIEREITLEIKFKLTLNIPPTEDSNYVTRKFNVWIDFFKGKLYAVLTLASDKIGKIKIQVK